MKNRRFYYIICMLLFFSVLFSACNGFSDKEKSRLEDVKNWAKSYYYNKYNQKVSVESVDYDGGSGALLPHTYTDRDDVIVKLNNGVDIYFEADDNMFLDTNQADEINTDFDNEIWQPFLNELGDYHLYSDFFGHVSNKHHICVYSEEMVSDTAFNELYDGNIKAFTSEVVDGFQYCGIDKDYDECDEDIYIIADSLSEYNKKYKNTIRLLKKYNIDRLDGPDFYFMTKDVFEKEKLSQTNDQADAPAFKEDYGYWGKYTVGRNFNDELYMKLAKGIYGAIDTNDEVKSEERVKLKAPTTEELKEFSKKYKEFIDSKNIVSSIYKIVLNKKTLKEIKGNYSDEYPTYFRLMFDNDELGIKDNYKFCLYNDYYDDIETIEVEKDKSTAKLEELIFDKGDNYLVIVKR